MNDNKVIAIDLSKGLLKALGRVSYAGKLNYGYDNENITALFFRKGMSDLVG
jgi:hypothetical protein